MDDVTASTKNTLTTGYMVGDLIPIAYMNSNTGALTAPSYTYLQIPKATFSSQCSDNSFAQFTKSTPYSSCNRQVYDLSAGCSTILNATIMFSKTYVASISKTTTQIPSNYVQINPRTVTSDKLGTLNYIPPSTFNVDANGNKICSNAITRVAYVITYDKGITAVQVDLWLTTVNFTSTTSSQQMFVPQWTSITFAYQSTALLDKGVVRNNSGNPGYNRGSPVIAGALTTVTAFENSLGVSQQSAIMQPIGGFNVYQGDCNGMSPVTVTFDQDLVSSCQLSLSLDDLRTICSKNDITILRQVDNYFNSFARFGNANLTNSNDWVTVQEDGGPFSTWDESTYTCNSLSGGSQYEIIIAQQGSTTNGQWKIAGVKRSRIAKKWRFNVGTSTLIGASTNNNSTTQKFWPEWRIRFVHLQSQSTSKSIYPIPNLLPSLPKDVFYPFELLSSGSTIPTPTSTIVLLIIIATVTPYVMY
ncbi:tectonic [Acrasis kona]|uniref:Tectonic n=1 Tax=Acrasis kona TaxID=1008807 RepID=A0AAW2YRH1_9EUKA